MPSAPIFYNPNGTRWSIVKVIGFFFLALLAVEAIIFAYFIVTTPRTAQIDTSEGFKPGTEGEIVYSNQFGELYSFINTDPTALVLTFDDGPDDKHTEQILDILKDYNVPATFFVVGKNATRYPGIIQRIYAEGHELGNHTYTHLDASKVGDTQFETETHATQRALESILGINTLLFRAPYSNDGQPTSPEELAAVEEATGLGYLHVGMFIDPKDWALNSPDAIATSVINQVHLNKNGNIILLHDSGDDRSATIAALPMIITELQNDGYTFTTIAGLLNISAEQIMQPANSNGFIAAGFNSIRIVSIGIVGLALLTVVFGATRFFSIIIMAVINHRRVLSRTFPQENNANPVISVIVPAYNEGEVVAKTIDSLVRSTYPHVEIIVVDDGSTDDTFKIAQERADTHDNVIAITKKNGGKSDAINVGVMEASGDIVVIIDADTVVAQDAIGKLRLPFSDPTVGAVAGNAKVGNRVSFMSKLQAIEYIASQNLERRAYEEFNAIRVVAGAIGAWRKEVLVALGGFTTDTLAEDTDMTLRILRAGYRVLYVPNAIAYTEAPETLADFLKQRFRWTHGTLQAIWKHKETLFRPKYRGLGFITIPDVILFQVIFPLFAPIMDILLILNLAATGIQMIHHPTTFSTEALEFTLFFYLIFTVIDLLTVGLAFILEPEEDKSLIWYIFAQRLVYRPFMYYVAIKSIIIALKGTPIGWNKLKRTASVDLDVAMH